MTKLQQANIWHFFLINYSKVHYQLSYQNWSLHFFLLIELIAIQLFALAFDLMAIVLQEKNLFKSNKNSNTS